MTEGTEARAQASTEGTETVKLFAEYQIAPDVLEALAKMGIETPTPIQAACIPAILEGRDVIGKAETGTGKTIGFGAPLVGRIDTNRVAVQALVLTPTRELAQQVAGVLELLGAGRGLGVALVVGGVHASEQVLKLRSGSQVVVGTPGRVLDFLRDRTLSLVWCETLVLDEADRMLDMGFIDDVSAIIEKTPPERQTLLFSATVPVEIQKLMRRYMRNPETHSTSQGLSTVAEIRQLYVECEFPRKFKVLQKLLDANADGTVIIFTNTRRQAIDLDRMLWGHGYSAGALHGEQEQDVRFKILESFRKGEVRILVATDVASRGLDIVEVSCVINYEIPDEAESYVHRIGRTGRAQRAGLAVSIVAGRELGSWRRVVRQTGFPVPRLTVDRIGKPIDDLFAAGATAVRLPAPLETGSAGSAEPEGRGRSRDAGSDAGREGRGRRSRRRGGGFRENEQVAAGGQGFGQEAGRRSGGGQVFHSQDSSSGGERFVAQENDKPRGMNESSAPEGGSTGTPGGPPSRPGFEDDGPRGEGGRRRRRRRRVGGDGPAGSERPAAFSTQRSSPEEPARAPPPQPAAPAEGQEGMSPDEIKQWLRDRPQAPKPKRITIEEMDDTFFKTDYFDVDASLVERAGPAPAPRAPAERDRAPQQPHREGPREGSRAGHGHDPQGRSGTGRGQRPHGRPAQSEPPAGRPHSSPRAGGGGQGQEADDPQRRRRRRRRGRGRGRGPDTGGRPDQGAGQQGARDRESGSHGGPSRRAEPPPSEPRG
jgi:ATP-dependent RNA helicase DeaD